MEPCRFDMGCWRPLCPYGHSGRRAARWAALWRYLEEEKASSRSTSRSVSEHCNDDLPVPQVMEELLEKFENIPQERISELTQITVLVPFQEETDEVIKLFPALYPAERISQRTAEQIVDASARSKLWKSQRPLRRGASRSVPSYILRICWCLKS